MVLPPGPVAARGLVNGRGPPAKEMPDQVGHDVAQWEGRRGNGERKERGRGWKVIRAEPLVTTLSTLSRGLERPFGFGEMPGQAGHDGDPSLVLRMTSGEIRRRGIPGGS